jgi:hypothetical protein
MRDFAAPTAKWAISETTAATVTSGIPVIEKNEMIGMNAPTAVESTPETAQTMGLLNPSSVVQPFPRKSLDERGSCLSQDVPRTALRPPRTGP